MSSEAIESILNHLATAAQRAEATPMPALAREIITQYALSHGTLMVFLGGAALMVLAVARHLVHEGHREQDKAKQDTSYFAAAIVGMVSIFLFALSVTSAYRLACDVFTPNAVLFDHVNQLKGNR